MRFHPILTRIMRTPPGTFLVRCAEKARAHDELKVIFTIRTEEGGHGLDAGCSRFSGSLDVGGISSGIPLRLRGHPFPWRFASFSELLL